MSQDPDLSRISSVELVRKLRDDLIPLNGKVGYFFAGLPLSDDDVQEYLREPFAALPPSVASAMPPLAIIMVPYLERVAAKANGRPKSEDVVSFSKPDDRDRIWQCKVPHGGDIALLFAISDQDVGEYHYSLYRLLADLAIDHCEESARDAFYSMLGAELNEGVHGEVDEQSWQLKQVLIRRKRAVDRKSRGFAAYARQSMLDTMTLYLHGICCDIDVETGPRQVASRHLRKRLELLHSSFPPPEGFAVFPEQLNHASEGKE